MWFILDNQVAFDKHSTKKKLREGAIIRGAPGNQPQQNQQQSVHNHPVMHANQTVIYTIPTTRQLAQQYPQMVYQQQMYVNGNNGQGNSPPAYIGN